MRRLRSLLLSAGLAAAFAAGAADATTLLTDGSFESPVLGAGGYSYAPVGSAWTFSGAALVSGAGSSAWYGGSAPAGMDGQQFAAVQSTGSVSQTFTAPGGALNLGWVSAGRPAYGCCNGDQAYNVLVDGVAAGSSFSTVSGSNFSFNSLVLSDVSSGLHTLSFQGVTGSDETAFLDNVILQTGAITPPAGAPVASSVPGNVLPANSQVVENFDDPLALGFTWTQGGPDSYVRSGILGLDPSISAPPPGDGSNYETVKGGSTATLTSDELLSSVSFYMGSPDSYNWVRFLGPGYDWTLSGAALFDPATAYGGDQNVGRPVTYSFGSQSVNRIIFGSDQNSFEFDDISVSAVPEPSTWFLLLSGVFGLGAALRTRRRARFAA